MPTLLAQLARHAIDQPDAPAYRAAGNTLSYRQLARGVNTLAFLIRENLPAGSTIILSAANQLQYPIAFLGILASGCTLFPISSESSAAELRRAAEESGAVGVIGDDRAIGLLGATMRFALSIHSLPAGEGAGSSGICGDLFLQSSGTTAVAKIVRRSGKSLEAAARAIVQSVGFTAEDRVLMTIPLSHSYGLEHGILAPIWVGSCVHLCPLTPLRRILEELEDGISILPGVPSTFEMLAADGCKSSLRLAYSAGAPLPAAVQESFSSRFDVCVTQLYGATEIGSVTYNPPGEPFESASVGQAMADVSVRIVDPETGAAITNGGEGHIIVRAGSMFSGYLDGPAELIDGHFPTGDLGQMDSSGRLSITGRIKLLIDVGGFKVNPIEVESVVMRHPAIESCIVVAVEQSATVRRLKAIVTPRDQTAGVSIDQLRELCRENLSTYKIPRVFEIRQSLPKSSTGKILRHRVEAS